MTIDKHSTLYLIIKTARPRQWIKNFALFAALVFSGFFFFDPVDGYPYVFTVFLAFLVFCVVTSSLYILNDITDKDADSVHPFKKKRPIASGKLPVSTAKKIAYAGLLAALFSSFLFTYFFQLLVTGYIALQFLYTRYFKHIPILDISSIATGFLVRIYAGAVVVNLHTDVWFLLTVISASLFLAVGKRQSERTLLKANKDNLEKTRKILTRYTQRLLDQYTAMFATTTWLTYALFAFQHRNPETKVTLASIYTFLPRTLQSEKLLMLSVPFVIFGIMRYLQLVYESNQGESPEKVLLNDKPLLVTGFLFIFVVMIVLYVLS